MKFKDFRRRYISPFAIFSLCFFAVCLVLKLAALISEPFADFFNRCISSLFRAAFAYATALLPFSLAELVIIVMIPLALLYLIYCATLITTDKLTSHLFNLIGTVFLLLSFFFINFGIAYDCSPLEKKAGLDTESLTANDIYDACIIALDELKEIEGTLALSDKGTAVMPYSFTEMSKRLNDSYASLYSEYTFLSPLHVNPKRIAFSKPMTYTGISGVYTFFTGEANVNMNFPDYSVTFTTAHEMAHQRGIAPEDEANFIAFVVCYTSDDSYLKYCALVEIVNFFTNTLYEVDTALFEQAAAHFSKQTLQEYTVHSEGYAPYADNVVNDVASDVNDTYLKAQGEKEGSESYGLVTTLATAYILKTHN